MSGPMSGIVVCVIIVRIAGDPSVGGAIAVVSSMLLLILTVRDVVDDSHDIFVHVLLKD